MILFGRHPSILVLTMQNLAWIVGGFLLVIVVRGYDVLCNYKILS